jgi:hypothetical protein
MSQENRNTAAEEESGGYGTPTVEQEMGGAAGNQQSARPRQEEDGNEEDKDSAGEPGAGRQGGTEDQFHAEADTNDPGFDRGVTPIARDADGVGFQDGDAVVPSAEAEIDESNADDQGSDEFSSEPGQEAAGLADGSGNDLPQEKSPKDDDSESFDAG